MATEPGRQAREAPPRVRLAREQRQGQLAEACAYLIATKGYSKTSVRDIAARVGISTGTLLHHYASKEDLLIATLMSVSNDFLEHVREAATGCGDAVARLRTVVAALLESPRHEVGWRVWIAFWHEAATNPELAAVAGERTELAESIFASLLAEGRGAGLLRLSDPVVSAAELAALIDGVALRMYGESRWPQERATNLVDRMIDDWLAD